jgi:hypothetical protein
MLDATAAAGKSATIAKSVCPPKCPPLLLSITVSPARILAGLGAWKQQKPKLQPVLPAAVVGWPFGASSKDPAQVMQDAKG